MQSTEFRMIAYLSFLAFIILTLTSVFGQQGCQFSRGGLTCTILGSTDFTPFLPLEDRDMVRWMTLYVGTSTNKHSDNSQPITYPDLSHFTRLAFLIIYIHSSTPSPNYVPAAMFETLNTSLTVLNLRSLQPVPIDVRLFGAEPRLEKLKTLRLTNFNITGVTSVNLGSLENLERLELVNTESGEGKERVLLDSVFRISKSLPKLKILSIKNFEFVRLFASRGLITPLTQLESLNLETYGDSTSLDVSVFFDKRIFPSLKSLELTGFVFSQISDPVPPLTRLKLKSDTVQPFSLATLSTATSLLQLYLTNFNLGNLTANSFRAFASLERLYLSGSEDTIIVSDDTFIPTSQLTHLRISRMPNLISFTDRSLIGLTNLTYLHIGTLNSLRTLDVDTSSLNQLVNLYITSNRHLSDMPVRFFRPLSALKLLSVRSNKFDEDCECRHSYLASLQIYSRAEPSFSLKSSCWEKHEFDKCQKNFLDTKCWDFEERCEDQCLPSGNLSYTCVCPAGMGQLGSGGKCVDLSRCALTSNGVTSHHCFLNKFTCTSSSRNSTISCSCYSGHAVNPGGTGCVSLSSCTLQGDTYLCGVQGLMCSHGTCLCIPGNVWNAFSNACVRPATTIITTTTPTASNPTTTTPTTASTETQITTTLPDATVSTTNTPTTTTTPTTTPIIPTTTPIVQITTDYIPTTTEHTTLPLDTTLPSTHPISTTLATTEISIEETTHTIADTATSIRTTIPLGTTTIQSDTTTILSDTTTITYDTTTIPSDTTTILPDTTTIPSDTTTIPPDTTTIPPDTTTILSDTTTIPPDTTTILSDTTTIPPDTTTIPSDTTTIPSDTTAIQSDTTTTPPTTGSMVPVFTSSQDPFITPIQQLQTLQSNVVWFTLGGICIGGLILIAASLLIILLVKIVLHSNGGKYKIVGNKSKPESLRSFESSNTSSTPTKFKELAV